MRTALILLAAGTVCLAAMFGGNFGPCGPDSILGIFGMLGTMICFPLAALFLLVCGLRALVQSIRRGLRDFA